MILERANGVKLDTGYDNIMKKVTISFFIITALIYVFFEVIFVNNTNYISTVEVFSVLAKFAMFLSAIVAYRLSKKPILIYLEIVFGIISIINVVFLITTINVLNVSKGIPYVCYCIHDVMDYITYISAIVLSKKANKLMTRRFLKISYFVYAIIPLAIIISTISMYLSSDYGNTSNLESVFCIDQFIFLGLLLVVFYIIRRNSSILKRIGVYEGLLIINILFLVAHIFSIRYIPYFNLLYRFSYFIRLFAFIIAGYLFVKVTVERFCKELVETIGHINSDTLKMQESFKRILDFMPNGVIIRNKENIAYANSAMIKLSGAVSIKNLLNLNITKLFGREYEPIIKNYSKSVYEGEDVSGIEEQIECFDGKRVWVEVSCFKIKLDGEDMILSLIYDITDRKNMEKAQKEILRSREREKVRGEFFANISHELRTPINVIYSALQVMQMHVTNENIENSKIKNYMKVIRQNCYRLLRIISNLIDITKIDAGFLKPNISRMEIVSLVENISMSIVTYLHQKGMELIFDTDVEEKYVECDADMIERVMLNLFSNAVKFRKKEGHVWINIHDMKNGSIRIEIKDDGIGIAKSKQSLIFQRFSQVDNSLIRRSQGSGIGLSLVKSIVDMNGGNIRFESEENVGTKFIIEFPTIKNEMMEAYSEIKSIKDSGIGNTSEKVKIEFADIIN